MTDYLIDLVMFFLLLFCILFSLSNSTPNSTLCSLCSYHGSYSPNLTCFCLPNWSGPSCANFTDPCYNNPCAHNATCTATNLLSLTRANVTNSTAYNSTRNATQHLHSINWNRTHQCSCPSNYTGISCEFEICNSSHCYNHGQCTHQSQTNLTCNCYPQYSGENCEDCVRCPDNPSLPCSPVSCTHGYCEVTPFNHMCHCSTGYEGIYCGTDINECTINPSICNSGRCVNTEGGYYCNCENTGYSGKNCEKETYECDPSPCKNGAACTEVSGPGYGCSCVAGWSGYTCEVHACQRTGTCVHGVCKRSPAPYTCDCDPGFEGTNCDQDVNECLGVTCENEGTCQDRLNSYLCDCKQGYTGIHCETRIDYCATDPCVHGHCTSQLTGYSCDCNPGYTGSVCNVDINDCAPNPCLNGTCMDGEHNFTCQCYAGYTGITCDQNVDDCAGDPCGAHGVCSDLLNAFTCTCNAGYTGELCQTLINYCVDINCTGHGICIASNCSQNSCNSTTDFFQCSCHPGYTGYLCGEDIDYCENSVCMNGECVEETTGYSCMCSEGFSGDFCSVNESSCVDSRCQNGTCLEAFPKHRCECFVGFQGESCQARIDYCRDMTCMNGSCVEYDGGASCVCDAGYYGDQCEIIDMCYLQPCLNGGNCTLASSISYTCSCPANYTGSHCETAVHSCAHVECYNNASCVDVRDVAVCMCSAGYTGQLCENKFYCYSDPCRNHGTCSEAADGFNCTCTSQYAGERCEVELAPCPPYLCSIGPGLQCVASNMFNNSCCCPDNNTVATCTGVDVCNFPICENEGVCGVFNSYTACICRNNYTGDQCEFLVDPCLSSPCNGEYCVATNQTSYECFCSPPRTGKFCESTVIPCENANNCSSHGTKLCVRNKIQETCFCHAAFSGDNCTTVLDCPSGFCAPPSVCVVVNGSFDCACNSSSHTHTPNVTTQPQVTTTATHASTHSSTTSTDRPTPLSPCASQSCLHGNCIPIDLTQYSCDCSPGFTGIDCDTKIDYCSQIQCANGGACTNGNDSAICHCLPNFAGSLCLFELTEPDYIFNDCAIGAECRHLFNNGDCDQFCANEESCLFDGLDCLEKHICPSTVCQSYFGNSVCNTECNRGECIFDGGDCFPDYLSNDRQFASGNLLITVQSPKTTFSFRVHVLPLILYSISMILHSMVVVDYVNEIERTPSRMKRQMLNEFEYSYVIKSRIDNSLCEAYCFGSAAKAAEFLNEYLVNSSIDTNQFQFFQITSTEDVDTSQVAFWQIATGVSLVVLIFLAFIGVGGVIIRKKRPRGIYFPRRMLSVHGSGERAALVESRGDAEEPEPRSLSNHSVKRTKLDITHQRETKSKITPSCRPPPYEAFQDYLPNAIFPPISEPCCYPNTPTHRASIELDHLMVDASPSTKAIPSLSTINARGIGGYTPLSLAVIIGNPTVCSDLPFPALPKHVHITSTASDIEAQHGVTSGMFGVDDLLKLGADANVANNQGATPLHLAAKYKHSDIAASLIAAGALVNQQDRIGHTPLHTAVASGANEVLQLLLANRSLNLNIQSFGGSTPLMLCVRHISNGLLLDLLEAHANVNLVDRQGYTALHWAASVNNVSALQSLIFHMGDIDCQNSRGETPLFLAAKEGNFDCTRALLQKHANAQIPNSTGLYPINIASNNLHKDIEELLAHHSFSDDSSEMFKLGSIHSTASKSKDKSSASKCKQEPKRVKKTPIKISAAKKVHPSTPKSGLIHPANIKREPTSPSPLLHTPLTPIHPLAAEYPADTQKYQSVYPFSNLAPSHPFPTPPNLHSEVPRHVQIGSVTTCYTANFPSPESSNKTASPANSEFNSLKNEATKSPPSASYPNHLLDANSLSTNQNEDPTTPNWDYLDWS